MEPVKVKCYYYDNGINHSDSFVIQEDNRSIKFSDVPEDFQMSAEQLREFMRLLSIRLQKIS